MIARFFSPVGRTPPLRLALVVVAALVLLLVGVRALAEGGLATYLLVGALWGALAAKLIAESVRRMHDRGRGGSSALLVIGVAAALLIVAVLHWLAYGPDPIVTGGIIVVALLLAVTLLWPGSAAANRYGPPPAAWRASEPGAPRATAGAWIGVVLTITGAATGFALFSWSEATRQAHDRNARDAAAYRAPPDPLAAEYNAQEARR